MKIIATLLRSRSNRTGISN